MLIILLKAFFHNGKEQIGIYFENDNSLSIIVRKVAKVRWSKTQNCWYLPLSKDNYSLIVKNINNLAKIDSTSLKEYLQKRNKIVNIKVAAAEKPVLAR